MPKEPQLGRKLVPSLSDSRHDVFDCADGGSQTVRASAIVGDARIRGRAIETGDAGRCEDQRQGNRDGGRTARQS